MTGSTDLDIDTTMVRLVTMNMMMHGTDNPHIHYKDTLSKEVSTKTVNYQIILAKPALHGNIDKGDINESLKPPTTKTELLLPRQSLICYAWWNSCRDCATRCIVWQR